VLVALCATASVGRAQPLLDTTLTLGKKPDPIVLDFAATAGSYRITVTDFGTPAGPVRLGRVDAAVIRGSQVVTSVNLTSAGSNVGVKNFTAAAGTHRLVLTARPTSPATVGTVGVRIDDPVGGAVLLDAVKVFTVPPAPTASPADFEDEFAVAAGTYTFEVTDFSLPQSLTLNVAVVPKSNPSQLILVTPGVPVQLTAGAAETFQVFTHAELPTGAVRGLLGLNLRATATGTTVASAVHELGEWPYRYTFDATVPATLTVTLTDLGFPFPLTALAAEVIRDGRAVTPMLAASATASFAATAGTYTVYAHAVPAATGPGSFGLRVAPPSPDAPLFDKVQNVVAPGPVTDVGTIDSFFDIATAGDYKLTLTDFGVSGFFDAFTSISFALTRDSQIVQTLNGPGSFTFAATPGHYSIAVVADPAGTAGEGLLGIRVQAVTTNAIVYDKTEAVGTDFITATVDVTSTQSVDVHLTDLNFPAMFDSVRVAVTRGAERVGEIVGGGTFTFAATPGTYIVNLLATPSATVGYSTLGLTVDVTPPAPGITFGAASTSVQAGGSAVLTWTSTTTTSCTASGGWTGPRAPTGTETVGPLNIDTTFTLTCVGPGGSKNASVSVTITPARRSGGGGAADWWLLGVIGIATLARRRRWHRTAAGF
jgi:hypothetical protein